MSAVDFSALDEAGLNLQAVIDLAAVPSEERRGLTAGSNDDDRFCRIILIGHAGRRLWENVQREGAPGEDPIDDFSARTVRAWLGDVLPDNHSRMVYPGGNATLNLQALGRRAGWHHDSPLMLGIQPVWGTWFAYRVVVLTDAVLPVSAPEQSHASPCAGCASTPCVTQCPAEAMSSGRFELGRCASYRLRVGSDCATTCVARIACPVGTAHAYEREQMHHVYSRSLRAIREFKLGTHSG